MSDFMKIDSNRLERASVGTVSTGGVPSEGDVTSFEQALHRADEREGRGGDQSGEQDKNDSSRDSPTGNMPMSNPLDSLFGGRMTAVTEVAKPSSMPSSSELVDKLLDRILVAEPKNGGSEVRLLLNDDILPGTEVRLLRGADGMLSISLVTDNASSFQTLVAAQDALRRQLEKMEGQDVRVDVNSESSGNESGANDTRQRSRGLPYEDEQA